MFYFLILSETEKVLISGTNLFNSATTEILFFFLAAESSDIKKASGKNT